MFRWTYILVFLCLVLSNHEFVTSKRFPSRHSYPKSHGLSGGGSHSSGGLSGGTHGYPSSGGAHGYPSSGGAHKYPSSGGAHGYPSSGGLSGNSGTGHASSGNSYPASKGLSGNSHTGVGHTTNVHYHYNYNPPQQIRYVPVHGGPPVNYPVYRGSPPTYVYQYKDSGSKYGTLLAGLALLNLGTLGVSAYALSKSHSNYTPKPGEVCKFAIKKDNGDYEETRIDCNLISSFIYEEEAKAQSGGSNTNTTVVTSVTNVTTINTSNGNDSTSPPIKPNPIYEMLPNGTLVPVNVTTDNTTATSNNASDGTMTSSVTVTTTNTTTVTSALDVKGKPIEVTPGMHCYVISHSPVRNMKKSVPCGLLQSYAVQSLKKNSASRNIPVISIFSVVLAILVAY